MNKIILCLSLIVVLSACATGSDNNGAPGAPGKSAYQIWLDAGNTGTEQDFLNSISGKSAYQIWLDAGNTGTEQDFLNWLISGNTNQNGSDFNDQLTDVERLFGSGNGLDAIPTELIEMTDNAGFSNFAFASWGNIYDLKQTNDTEFLNKKINGQVIRNKAIVGEHLNFLSQTQKELETYTYYKDASVANTTFKGPAIMYILDTSNIIDQDYGSMKLSFGQDISNISLEFVMHNPSNSISIKPSLEPEFSEDRNKVDVHYKFNDETNPSYDRYYHGYGIKE